MALRTLTLAAIQDASLANSVANFPWLHDEVAEDERWAVRYLYDIARRNGDMAQNILSFPWFADGVTENERWAVRYIRDIAREDFAMAQNLLGFPWLADDLTEDERWAVRYVWDIAQEDLAMAQNLLGFPWFADGVTEDEKWAVRYVWGIAREDTALANRIANSPFLQPPFRSRDRYAIQSVRFLQTEYPDLLAHMLKQDWFADGLSDDEAALVTIFGREFVYFTINELRPFLTDHRMESRTVLFPLRGEVLATDIQATRGRSRRDITSLIEEAAVEIESFMGIPFPQNDLILLLASCRYSPVRSSDNPCGASGLHRGSHMIVDPLRGIKDARGTLIHEVAHFYWNSSSPVDVPVWFYEGGADFLESYVQIQLYGETLESRKRRVDERIHARCRNKGIDSVQEIVDKLAQLGSEKYRKFEFHSCHYYYGEMLFLQLYHAIGEDAFRAAWQEIYETSRGPEERSMTEEEIYRKFLENAPADNLDAFREVYRKWHGGDFIE